jgi:hypothetical protein
MFSAAKNEEKWLAATKIGSWVFYKNDFTKRPLKPVQGFNLVQTGPTDIPSGGQPLAGTAYVARLHS